MAEDKAAGRDWEKLWNTVWYNLFHVLGIGAVLAVVVAIAWETFGPDTPASTSVGSRADYCVKKASSSEAQQTVTSINLLSSSPCARKSGGGTDLSACYVFGLRPGMSDQQVIAAIDTAGYFPCATTLQTGDGKDKEKAQSASISQFKDGFSVLVEFAPAGAGAPSSWLTSSIKVVIGPGGNPYFDPGAMRPTMRKLFGQPATSTDTSDEWNGKDELIRAYSYKQHFWIVLERPQ
jgi:hypothetical protein